MHFSKTYAQLLLSLPPQLRDNAIQYRQLKKLINQIVLELTSLGLSPAILQEHLLQGGDEKGKGKQVEKLIDGYKVVYEVNEESGHIEPRLRFWVTLPDPTTSDGHGTDEGESIVSPALGEPGPSLLWVLQRKTNQATEPPTKMAGGISQEVVIPLVSDSAFFQLLSTALKAMSDHLATVQLEFSQTLHDLSRTISDSARPASATASGFRPYSILTHPGAITIGTAGSAKKTDLNAWREIFQLYVEIEPFESVSEASPGERSVGESEKRLKLFVEQVTQRGLGDERQLKMKNSRAALESFLKLNMFILHVKKFQSANSEATRKILKKHAKRTALQLPDTTDHDLVIQSKSVSLPRILVQAIGEILLPVIPHLDDYACLICTNIAFKPIRLSCGHLFCARCLVKMQKRGQGDCPMCRAPTVLCADRSNVDWALLNFMQDWFPVESKQKLKDNEKEAAREQMLELGIDPEQGCKIM
ncbi:SPX domain-containing protein [Desarmillaria ectypa]|nr:SPX domain-containing protein [Desarmillaria ectypa]